MIPLAYPYLNKIDANLVFENILIDEAVSKNEKVKKKLETKFSYISGYKNNCFVNNGTAALIALFTFLKKKGLGPKIAIPNITFGATVNAALLSGLEPVLIDVDYSTGLISIEQLAITTKRLGIKIACLVSLNGRTIDVKNLDFLKSLGLVLVEDAAETPVNPNRKLKKKNIYLASTFSFFGNKIFTSGEGGAISTDDHELHDFLQFYINHGMSKTKGYNHEIVGNNLRLSGMSMALLNAQLSKVNEIIKFRKEIYEWYASFLNDRDNFHIYKLEDNVIPWLMEIKSVKLSEKLVSQKNIFFEWRPMFSPMNIQKAFNTLIYENRTNNSLNFFNDSIFLPLHHKLYKEDIFKICDYISNLTNK